MPAQQGKQQNKLKHVGKAVGKRHQTDIAFNIGNDEGGQQPVEHNRQHANLYRRARIFHRIKRADHNFYAGQPDHAWRIKKQRPSGQQQRLLVKFAPLKQEPQDWHMQHSEDDRRGQRQPQHHPQRLQRSTPQRIHLLRGKQARQAGKHHRSETDRQNAMRQHQQLVRIRVGGLGRWTEQADQRDHHDDVDLERGLAQQAWCQQLPYSPHLMHPEIERGPKPETGLKDRRQLHQHIQQGTQGHTPGEGFNAVQRREKERGDHDRQVVHIEGDGRKREALKALQQGHDQPAQPEQQGLNQHDPHQAHGEVQQLRIVRIPARYGNRQQRPRKHTDQQRDHHKAGKRQRQDCIGQLPGPVFPPILDQAAKDGHQRRAKRAANDHKIQQIGDGKGRAIRANLRLDPKLARDNRIADQSKNAAQNRA